MNLKELREKIYSLSDYKPGNPTYTETLDRIIRDAYKAIWNVHTWSFAVKHADIELHTDIDAEWLRQEYLATTGTDTPIYLAIITGSPQVRFTVNPTDILDTNDQFMSNTLRQGSGIAWERPNRIYNNWIGQEFEIYEQKYEIKKITNEGILLDRGVQFTNPESTITDPQDPGFAVDNYYFATQNFKIKSVYTYLPSDIQELYSVALKPWNTGASENQILQGINWFEAARVFNSFDTTGTPQIYINSPDIMIPGGETLSYTLQEVESSDDGNFESGKTYEFAYAHMGPGGNIGSPSKPVKISIPSAETTTYYRIVLDTKDWAGYDNANRMWADTYSAHARPVSDWNLEWNRILLINRNIDESTGRALGSPKWVPINLNATQTPSSNDSATTPLQSLGFLLAQFNENGRMTLRDYRVAYNSGNYPVVFSNRVRRVQLYPRSDIIKYENKLSIPVNLPEGAEFVPWRPRTTTATLSITYKYLPLEIVNDYDSIDLKFEFSNLVVRKALVEVFLLNNDLSKAQVFQGLYDKELKALIKRYSSSSDSIRVKGEFGSPFQSPFAGRKIVRL